jgi:hypothetical protein
MSRNAGEQLGVREEVGARALAPPSTMGFMRPVGRA